MCNGRFTRAHTLLLACFAALGAYLGWDLIGRAGSVFFYQMFTPEALMWACGRGFVHPLTLSPEMLDFLLYRRAAHFDCTSIPADLLTGPPGFFSRMQIYLTWAAAGLWRWLGPSQMSLAPLVMTLTAGYAAAAFCLARLFLPVGLAILAAAVITLSPVATSMIFQLRDYAKAPFFLWVIALLVMAVRADETKGRAWRAGCVAGVAGFVAGVGYGFRSDLAIMLPLGVVFLAIGSRPQSFARMGAAGSFAAMFLLAAAPILALGNGGNAGMLAMQGATEPFRAFLALRPAPYALGHAYLDELTLSGVAAAEMPRSPGWDAAEGAPIHGVSQAITLSTQNLLEWGPNFAADFMAQGLKGAAWILAYPTLARPSHGEFGPGAPPRLEPPLTVWVAMLYEALGKPWMPILGVVGMMCWLLRTAADRPQEAWGLAGLLLALMTYPALQFAGRHVFHLEFIWVISVLSIPCAIWQWRRNLAVMPRFLLASAAVVLALAGSYSAAAAWQQRRLTEAFANLLSLPREEVLPVHEGTKEGQTFWRVPVPAGAQSVMTAMPDSMTDRIAEVGIEHAVRAFGARMLLQIDGPTCPLTPARIELIYDARPGRWQSLDSTLNVAPGSIAVFPAFYRATQAFAGIRLPASHEQCDLRVWTVPITYDLPMVLTAVLPLDWQALRLRKGLGRFPVGLAE